MQILLVKLNWESVQKKHNFLDSKYFPMFQMKSYIKSKHLFRKLVAWSTLINIELRFGSETTQNATTKHIILLFIILAKVQGTSGRVQGTSGRVQFCRLPRLSGLPSQLFQGFIFVRDFPVASPLIMGQFGPIL